VPSVRGRERVVVGSLLIAAGGVTGALVGMVAGAALSPLGGAVLWAGQPDPSGPPATLIAVVIGLGVVLDVVRLTVGRPAPPTCNRQVPQEWGRLFDPRVVAVLYGARLGVGPLTILSTWTWWSVTVAAGLVGPGTGAAVGGCFGLVRLVITVATSLVAERRSQPMPSQPLGSEHASSVDDSTAGWFLRLQARQRPNWLAINGLGAAAAVALVLTGCGGPSEDTAQQPTTSTSISVSTSTSTPTSRLTTSTSPWPSSTTATPGIGAAVGSAEPADLETLVTVPLEDVVRPDQQTNGLAADETAPIAAATVDDLSAAAETGETISSSPEALAEALIEGIDGFAPVDDPNADRYLDLDAASQIQPDPTEEVALLETRGFEGGWTRAFRNANNDVAVASVYQFEDATEAEFYLEDGLITIGGYGGKFFDLDDHPGVRGFVQYFTETDADGTEELVSLGASFQTGPRWHLVYFVGSTETITPDLLIPAIEEQRQLAGRL
jgi:hypothetical protein